ncbi:hypothetical protein [Profundibacter amoris]|uniref:Alpha/beta hydrolase n=1 Tax=Profundibacter amoris TaxID=2171755 RepID=A0A347UFM4_9RHOB|nr:hypothetical protein [Profundibacter amoris]AXX97652.1 hypothetical protein BAR1_06730 [Profundibacter amoris]
MQGEGQTVAKRRVFYIPGYDPIHPRRYRELYRSEGAEQAKISGYTLDLSPKQGGGRYGWHVQGRIDGMQVEADFDVLVWSDIVKSSMDLNIPQTYLVLTRTAWTYIASGALRRLMWLRKGPVLTALYPIGMLLLQLLVAVFLAWFVGAMIAKGVRVLVDWPLVARMLGWAAALPLIVMILRGFRKIDNKLFAYYLMHDYAYSARSKGQDPPELVARMAEFADEISAALNSDLDEVLVVGHSSGAHIGVSVLADLIRAGRVPRNGPALGFLTLGQVMPMVSFLPRAYRLRADLKYLSMRDELTWVDVSAPGDVCAFSLCDPVAVTGVAPKGKRWPLVISAAFTQTLSPNRRAALKWRYFRLHFQYLCAFDRPGDYDYFKITAGPETLHSRYRNRQPSKSRIDVPASPFTSVTP